MADAIAILKQQGAVIVDPADIPSFVDKDPKSNFLQWDYCSGADQAKGKDETCSVDFKYGMKRDFNKWLASLGPSAPVKTLAELRQWNLDHAKAGAIKYGQSRLDISDEMDLEADRARYEADHRKDLLLSRDKGIDGVLKADQSGCDSDAGSERGGSRRAGRVSDHRGAVRDGSERAHAAVSGWIQCQARAVRRRVYWNGLQRAAADRVGVCVRAGDQAEGGARVSAVIRHGE